MVHFLQLITTMKTQFHFHIDGIGLNKCQIKTLGAKWGFFADNFEHTFVINNQSFTPFHYTLIKYLDINDKNISSIYEEVIMFLNNSNFIGHFQVEMFDRSDVVNGKNPEAEIIL